MELAAYEGGAGGKFRRRPTRRPAATPYDRPPSAVRGLRAISTDNGRGGGWLSKLVDPASRFISGSASKLFSSVFRKLLTAPPVAQEQNSQVRLDVPEAVDSAPIELHGQEMVDGQNPIKNVDTNGISEIEQLLKQKTYTRAQVDYLTELIRIRTIEPPRPESESNNEKVHISHKGNGIRSSGLNKHLSTSTADLSIPQDVAASPAEIAKAYMSSRPPKAGYSAISLRSPIFTEDQNLPSSVPFSSKSPGLSALSQSVLRSSEAREFSGMCYDTPRPRGRSAIYRMSRSPYFMADPSVNRKENDYTTGSRAGPTSSQWTPGSTSKSDVKQVLKRGRQVLDSDYGSFGPIRRIRQKSGLISAAKESLILPSSSLHGFKGPATQKPSSLNEIKFASTALQISENGDNNFFSSKFPLVSEQSSEFGRRILEQLDKFVPSPGGKSHAKLIARDESPSKLTSDMLNGRALRSMENVNASQFISMDANSNSDFSNEKVSQNLRAFESEKLLKAEENGFSKTGVPGAKFAAASNGVSRPVLSNKNARPIISSADTTISTPASFLSQRKPAFQMTAPEDSLEVDDEHDAVDIFVQSTSSMAKAESKIANLKASVSSISAPEKPLLTSAKSMGASSSISFPEASKKAYGVSYISEKDSSYKFPVAIESGEHSLPAITPTMPTIFQDKQAAQSEQKVGPAFIFGSRTTDTPVPSIVSSESGPELRCPDSKIQSDGSNMGMGVRSDAGGLHKSPGIVGSSSLSTPSNTETAAFGSLVPSPRINGSVPSSSISSFVSASTTEANARSPVSSFFSNSTSTTTSSSSSTLPPFSSTTMFSFGAGASIAAPVSVSPLQDQSNLLNSEGKIANHSPFGSASSTAHDALAFFSTGSSSTSSMGSSPFSGTGNAYSAVTMPTSSPSILTSSAPATPYSFSGVSSSGSDLTASPSLPSKSNGIFGIGASVQATSTIFSAASSSAQNSNIGVGGSTIVAQPAQSDSGTSLFSQSSTSQLGSLSSSATPGLSSSSYSIFGSSSPSTFGINSSSSPGFSYVPFSTTNQSANPFSSSSGFNFSSGNSSSSNSGFPFSSGVSAPSSGFSSIASGSNSSSGLSLTGSSTSNSGFSFCASASGSQTPTSSISSPAATSSLFGSSSLGSTSSNSGSVFGSSPSTGFSFGLTAPASGVTSFGFGSSPGSVFSFASAGSTATPVFGMQSPAGGLCSISQNNDQMSVEDTMADDTSQAPAPMVSIFGQPNSAPASSNFVFGSAVPSSGASVFQFGSHQNPPVLQNPNPFQAGGNLEFAPGGSFSLGSGGGEKSARKIVKVRRDKIRRK